MSLYCFERVKEVIYTEYMCIYDREAVNHLEFKPHYFKEKYSVTIYDFGVSQTKRYCATCWFAVFSQFEYPEKCTYTFSNWTALHKFLLGDTCWCRKCNSSLFNVNW